MLPLEGATPVAGVCFARGVNAEVPPRWLIYIVVDDLDESTARCERLGGKVLQRRPEGVCIIEGPAAP